MISPSTLTFLTEISENNNREWFQQHKEKYNAARENILGFTGTIIREIAKIDETIPADLSPESCVMRIYRDIRFSKDKTPYKTNIGIGISSKGKSFNGPGYYIHIQPGKSFIAGGSWNPETEQLKAIRQEIDYNSSDFLQILNSADFKGAFGTLDTEEKLKTAPKGYPSDHDLIEFLKLKCFVATKTFTDKEVQNSAFPDNVISTYKKLYPFMVFLRNAIS